MNVATEQRVTRLIFVASFLFTTILLVALSLKFPLRSNIAASYLWGVALVIGTMIIGQYGRRSRRLLHFFLVVSVLNLALVPAEAVLRLRGFRYESGIQFGYPRPYQFDVFEPHEKLFWRFPPAAPGINSYGFRCREVERPKAPGTFRILFLGNSCTYQGFPQMIELILRDRDPLCECLNFAMPGYTSYQGRVVIDSYIDEIDPDLLVVSFGWNDRWLAYGAVDEEKEMKTPGGGGAALLGEIYSRWRLLQFGRKALSPVMGGAEPLDTPRVPLEHFRRNLTAIGERCRERGVPVVFATEPSSHPSLGVPDYVVQSNYAASKGSSLALFVEYNAAVRKIARLHEEWYLVDLDSLISDRSDVRDIFTGDGLHFSPEGLTLVSEIESRFIRAHFLE